MTSPLPPEMRKPIPPPKEYRDPEPPMGMRATPTPASGPVNPNAGMMGKALAIQREQNKKAMINPSGTAASPSGRVRTGVPFYEVPRGRGMQTPMNLPTPMMGRNPPEPVREPVMPPEPVREPVREPVMPEREPPPRDIPMALPTRRIVKVGESVTPKNYAKGGMVKASRGDGIASRGRTRGKLC
jgi:hypothetical protein